MKKSEKEKLLDTIRYYASHISNTDIKIINLETVETILENMPTEKDDIKELYAIRDLSTGDIIWSARGSAYKELDDVKKKLNSLDSGKSYKIITYKLEE